METIITQLQLLPYRHIPNLIHDALNQVINPTIDHRIPNQERILQPALHISQLSIQRTKKRLQRIQTGRSRLYH